MRQKETGLDGAFECRMDGGAKVTVETVGNGDDVDTIECFTGGITIILPCQGYGGVYGAALGG